MANETEIRPALTAEEWDKSHGSLECDSGGTIFWGGDVFLIEQDANAIPLMEGEEEDGLHAVAALALFGQPFGFTEADVTTLLALLVRKRVCDAITIAEAERLESLATRIAALLPPNGH